MCSVVPNGFIIKSKKFSFKNCNHLPALKFYSLFNVYHSALLFIFDVFYGVCRLIVVSLRQLLKAPFGATFQKVKRTNQVTTEDMSIEQCRKRYSNGDRAK